MMGKYPMSRIDAYYYFRFSIGLGVILGQLASTRLDGVIIGAGMILIAAILRLREDPKPTL